MIGPRSVGIARARTRPAGAATSTSCCRPVARYRGSGTCRIALRRNSGLHRRAEDAAGSCGTSVSQFAILTAARTSEVIGARWNEIDVAEKLWTVPAERMKAGKQHRVPLSERALAIVLEMQPLIGIGDGQGLS